MSRARSSLPVLFLSICAELIASAALAIDHANLDEGRPLLLQDAYSIAYGELAIEGGAGFRRGRESPDRGVFQLQLLYGALPNLQVELGTELFTSPHSIDEPERSGDLQLAALYNFNQETIVLPALAAEVSVNFPTGVDSAGVDTEITAIATKSLGRLSGHLNGSYQLVTGTSGPERRGIYQIVLGATYPIGAPKYTRLTLLTDGFTRRSALEGDSNIFGIEAGARYQMTERWVLDGGVGSEFAGHAERSDFYFTVGASFGF